MENRFQRRVESQAWFLRHPRGVPIALFLLGLTVTLLMVFNIELYEGRKRKLELDRDATELQAELQRKATENLAYLNAAASLLSASNQVSPLSFERFVADLSQNYASRGTLGMGWARWIKARDVKTAEAELRTVNKRADLTIRPAPIDPEADMAVIELLQPATAQNSRALGFDMNSEAVRRAAMAKAVKTARIAVTGQVHLVQDEGRAPSAGVLLYLPVYPRNDQGERASTVPLGFAYIPLRLEELVTAAGLTTHHGAAGARLYDGAPEPDNLLAEIGKAPAKATTVARTIAFGDRTWTLTISDTAPSGLTRSALWVAIGGTLLSLLLLGAALVIINRAAEDRRVLEALTAQEAIRTSLTRELNHRVKNTLANVLSIVALTKRRTSNMDDFADSLSGRIRALSATHDLLSQRNWKDAPVRDVVISEVAPYLDVEDRHIDIVGPDLVLSPNDALSLGLALHELATNAAKYGALSVNDGHVAINWELTEPTICAVHWRETGGPTVSTPNRRGFGLDLIEKIVSHELRHPVDLRFAPEGVICTLRVPVRTSGEFALRA